MKRNYLVRILCLTLILMLGIMPICSAYAASKAYILRVNTNFVHVRDKDSNIISTARKGTRVLYWGEQIGDMCKVMSASGYPGYIYKGYLSSYGVVNKNQIGIVTSRAPLYKRSGNSLKKAGTVKAGTTLLVYQVNGSWAYVKNLNGTSAYIRTSYLKQVF